MEKKYFTSAWSYVILVTMVFLLAGCGDIIGPIDLFGNPGVGGTPTVPPYEPSLVAPTNLASGVDTTVFFGWLGVYSASSYTLEVALDSQFKNLEKTFSTKSTTCSIVGFASGMHYYWRVKAENTQGSSQYSEVYQFKTKSMSPVLLTPVNGATGLPSDLTISWNSVRGAASYSVEISLLDTFTTYVYRGSSITKTGIQPMGLVANTTYYWHVRALTDTSYTAYSKTFSFSTGS